MSYQDKDCVDELMALDSAQSKMAKRKLRFERCKSAAKMEAIKKNKVAAEEKEKASKDRQHAFNAEAAPKKIKAKGNPALGEKLKDLPKVCSFLSSSVYTHSNTGRTQSYQVNRCRSSCASFGEEESQGYGAQEGVKGSTEREEGKDNRCAKERWQKGVGSAERQRGKKGQEDSCQEVYLVVHRCTA